MTPRENATERLHVMVTPSQKEKLARAAALPQFSSEAAVIRYLLEADLTELLEVAEEDRNYRLTEKERAARRQRAAEEREQRYAQRTRLLVDTSDPAPYADDPLGDIEADVVPAAPRPQRPQVSLRPATVTTPPMVEMPSDPFDEGLHMLALRASAALDEALDARLDERGVE